MHAIEKRVLDLSEIFDVLIINLAADTARRESCVLELAKVGFKPIFIEAEDGSGALHHQNRYLRSGASACFASHVKAWDLASTGSKKYIIIMEDDVQILDTDKFMEILEDVATTHLEIVQLGFLNTGFRQFVDIKLQNIEVYLLKIAAFVFRDRFAHRLRVQRNSILPRKLIADDFRPGAHCYVLTSDVATRLVSKKYPFVITLDAYLMALSWHQAFKVARVRKSLVGQKDFPSRIKSS